jgi:5-methylcytosine-specific restriction endonuclease McrA
VSRPKIQGNPCKRGHSGLRYELANGRPGNCVECIKAARTAWVAANPERQKARKAAWRAANPERHRASAAAWAAANPERQKARQAAWYAANSERAKAYSAAWYTANREKAQATIAAWRAANPDAWRVITSSKSARRRARKLAQICHCCTTTQLLDVYRQAGGMEVDHIVPLALGGLHCRANMQILTKEEHKAKTRLDLTLIRMARKKETT